MSSIPKPQKFYNAEFTGFTVSYLTSVYHTENAQEQRLFYLHCLVTPTNFDWVSRLLTEFSSLFHSLTDEGKQYMETHDSGILRQLHISDVTVIGYAKCQNIGKQNYLKVFGSKLTDQQPKWTKVTNACIMYDIFLKDT